MAIQIGKIAGIPIALDYSWFIIFILIAWTIGFNLMPQTYPGLAEWEYLFIGVLSSILLFGSGKVSGASAGQATACDFTTRPAV